MFRTSILFFVGYIREINKFYDWDADRTSKAKDYSVANIWLTSIPICTSFKTAVLYIHVNVYVKGSRTRYFRVQVFFHESVSPGPPCIPLHDGAMANFYKNLRRYSQL